MSARTADRGDPSSAGRAGRVGAPRDSGRERSDPGGAVILTAREEQVLALIAEGGGTNRQIARALYISDETVSVHVSSILAELGAGGRTEAAVIARRDGLLPRS